MSEILVGEGSWIGWMISKIYATVSIGTNGTVHANVCIHASLSYDLDY